MVKLVCGHKYKKTMSYLEKLKEAFKTGILDRYGIMGVEALRKATPVDTGLTARSWEYRIERTKTGVSIVWNNTNIQNGCPIAIILQYGHATRNGGYVQGVDYINPALEPIFRQIARDMWEEVIAK